MKPHKIIYLSIIPIFLFSCTSEKYTIENKIYSFSSKPYFAHLNTKEVLYFKFETSWNICNPDLFWKNYKIFNEKEIHLEVYKNISVYTRVESSEHNNDNFLTVDPEAINAIQENVKSEVGNIGICIKKLHIIKV